LLLLVLCCALGKGPRDMLFDTFDATDLNKELKRLMDGLSVKVGSQSMNPP
jgi:hypothetical protein